MIFLDSFYQYVFYGMSGLAVIVFLVLFFISAPYGRHERTGWGPTVSARTGWIVMEAPACLIMLVMFLLVPGNLVIYLLLFVWQIHYFHRAFVYPFTLNTARPMPWLVVLFAIIFNTINAYLNGWHFVMQAEMYAADWVYQPQFVVGLLCFAGGFFIVKKSDAVLRTLRQPGETEYKIPEGFLYRGLSCPNYFGESIQWLGFALMTQSPAAWLFLVWTLANLLPRAVSHHRWYRQKFPDYPGERKAMIPFLV